MRNTYLSDKKDLSKFLLIFFILMLIYFFIYQSHSFYTNYPDFQNNTFLRIIFLYLTVVLYIASIYFLIQYLKKTFGDVSTKEKSTIYIIINIFILSLLLFFDSLYLTDSIRLSSIPYYYQNLSILFLLVSIATLVILGISLLATNMFFINAFLTKFFPDYPITINYSKFYTSFSFKGYFIELCQFLGYPLIENNASYDNDPNIQHPISDDPTIFINKPNNTLSSNNENNCPKCGNQIAKNVEFCQNCGKKLP